MKNKQYFLQRAIVKTIATGLFYLLMPIPAKYYFSIIGTDFVGYTIFGVAIMILLSVVLLIRAWAFAFDADLRNAYLKED